ncbi:MAG: alpha/beta fold hydrolase [Candidatus Lokiarchaeota archaeon]|nr:alpha/beta fold hydrolase [Candidatus Lokiarchaeota archaeon]
MKEENYLLNNDYWFNYCLDIDPKIIKKVIKEIFIETSKNRIHLDIYDEFTNKSKPTILFVHGTAVYSRFYAEFLYSLHEQGYRIIGLDLPGHGLSDGRRGHFSIEELVSTISEVNSYIIENYNEDVVLIGSSLGGILTLYTIAFDERFKAGVCVNTALLNEKEYQKEHIKVRGIYKILKPTVPFFSKLLPRLSISVWAYLDAKNLVKNPESIELIDILLQDKILAQKYTLKSLATQMKAALNRPVETIETPIMLLNGSHDIIFSVDYMQRIYERLKNSKNKRIEIIPNSSHMVLLENRTESIQKIVNWLSNLE